LPFAPLWKGLITERPHTEDLNRASADQNTGQSPNAAMYIKEVTYLQRVSHQQALGCVVSYFGAVIYYPRQFPI